MEHRSERYFVFQFMYRVLVMSSLDASLLVLENSKEFTCSWITCSMVSQLCEQMSSDALPNVMQHASTSMPSNSGS